MANPPFMSPKGGIQPHKRFSVQSNRSEVLFVDYMAEHLSAKGRAGIIVPEGIIFQSQNAYKSLRKMLVEQYLVAVVSLPAGVFNPYSGVKTSILILDKSLARQSDTVGFFKVENDGFNLGAQRRPIDKNDLPRIRDAIIRYIKRLKANESTSAEDSSSPQELIVSKEKIASNGEFNLNGDRYRANVKTSAIYPLVPVGEFMKRVVKTIDPRSMRDDLFELWSIPAHDAGRPEILKGAEVGSQKKLIVPGDVLLSRIIPHIRRVRVVPVATGAIQIASTEWIVFAAGAIDPTYLSEILRSDCFHSSFMQTITGVGGSLARANPKAVSEIRIPVPPLDVQKEIVLEIEAHRALIEGARMVISNYRPQIAVNDEWPLLPLGELLRKSSESVTPATLSGAITYIGLENITPVTGELTGELICSDPREIKSTKTVFAPGDILYGKLRPNLNKVWLADRKGVCSTDILVLKPATKRINTGYLVHILRGRGFNHMVMGFIKGAQLPRVSWSSMADIRVPCPPQATQSQIVSELESERELVVSNRELVRSFEAKIRKAMARVWGEHL